MFHITEFKFLDVEMAMMHRNKTTGFPLDSGL